MKTIIISLGGSIIVPDKINTVFLKKFRELILQLKDRYKFVIYCGGGSVARKYQKAFEEIRCKDNEAMDWIGISATHLNAFLMRSIFHEDAEEFIIEDPTKKIIFNKSILIAGGWKPGWSTDYDSVLLAKNLKADTVINMTNVDYLYTKDPGKHKDAKPIKQATFKQIKEIINDKWSPGLNAPFDPVAIRAAEKQKTKIIIVGTGLNNLNDLLQDKPFKGTVIKD